MFFRVNKTGIEGRASPLESTFSLKIRLKAFLLELTSAQLTLNVPSRGTSMIQFNSIQFYAMIISSLLFSIHISASFSRY